MRIAIAQSNIHFEALEYQLEQAVRWTAQSARNGADCIVFPEMSFTGFSMHVKKIAAYSTRIIALMKQLAQQHKIAIGFGWVSENEAGMGQNHYTLMEKTGEIRLDYIKIHPFSYGKENQFFQSGSQIQFTSLCKIPISTLICYDLRFPELFRLAARHAALILVPANWLKQRSTHWDTLLRARAIENQVYILGVNCVGTQQDYHFVGGSCLINPEGKTIASCGTKEQLIYVEIENDISAFRAAFPTYQDVQLSRYAEMYQQEMQR